MVLEILRLRVRAGEDIQAARELGAAFAAQERPAGLGGMDFYASAVHQNEIMLVLRWEEPGPGPAGSPLGRALGYRLKRLGLMEWSLWAREANGPEPGA